MDLVFIYGPPGVGKLTVAKELARLTGYKLFDNHASIDVIKRVFDFGDEPFWPLVHRLRFDVLEAAARHGVDLIGTGAYVYPDDTELTERIHSIVEEHAGRVLLTHLVCSMDELEQRVPSESRANKLDSWEIGLEDMARYDFFTPIPGRESLSIDNTDLAPDEVARRIVAHYGLPTIA